MNLSRFSLLVLAVGAVSGCVSLLPAPSEAPRLYVIETTTPAASAAPLPVVLSVARPATPQALSGRDIAWRRGVELAYLDSAAWEGDAPAMLHRLLLDSLDRQNLARAVIRVADGSLADFELRWDVLRFEVVEDSPTVQRAALDISARLVGAKSRTVLAATRISHETPLASRSARDAVAALGATANATALDLGAWARTVMSDHPSAASTSR
jgi:ABC-type uncharacterized transport system auxiliary subunit